MSLAAAGTATRSGAGAAGLSTAVPGCANTDPALVSGTPLRSTRT